MNELTKSQLRDLSQFLFNCMLDGKAQVKVTKYHVYNKVTLPNGDFIEKASTTFPPLIKTLIWKKDDVIYQETYW